MICLLLFLLSCENIVWKKGVSLPYKIEKGQYQFNIYELECKCIIPALETASSSANVKLLLFQVHT